jgi:hypothetical protein
MACMMVDSILSCLSLVTGLHCPKTTERNFNLVVLNLCEIHFIALFSVKYPYLVSNVSKILMKENIVY